MKTNSPMSKMPKMSKMPCDEEVIKKVVLPMISLSSELEKKFQHPKKREKVFFWGLKMRSQLK